jgi:multicomponent Na+:H+ antiporter subunit E
LSDLKIVFFICLLVFWFVIAGFSGQGLIVGFAASIFVYWVNRDLINSLAGKGYNLVSLVWLGLFLLWQLFLANLALVKIILNPKRWAQPRIVTFNPGLKKDFSKTILANAITFTPGTLTVDVQGDIFTVHALTLAAAQKVVAWPLISLLRRMEERA